MKQKFTGKERDAETGLDYFGARYMSAAQGRFTSADPKMFPGQWNNPQSWNKYSYTGNNPLLFVDPDGEDWGLPTWNDVRQYGSNLAEAGRGFVRGASASVTYGLVGGPEPGDSELSRLGQNYGTAFVAHVGGQLTIQGGSEVGGGLVLAPETGGSSLGAVGEGAVKTAVGAVLVTGAAKNAQALINAPAQMALAKPPTGPGSVPPDQRDPKRSMTPKEKGEKLAEQNGNCAHCDKKIEGEAGIAHHDPVRHADGGREMKIVHKACHDELHGCK